jgi:pantetheine-phosphate adenylyltransferase
VCIGGTFDRFHRGHEALIEKAFEVAGKNGSVFIGLTKDNIRNKNGNIESYEKRRQYIKKVLKKKKLIETARIEPIFDRFGPSIEEDFDAIIVSSETYTTGEEINIERIKRGKKPLKIIQIPFVLAEDQKPISSSRIRKKEIDKNGNIQK